MKKTKTDNKDKPPLLPLAPFIIFCLMTFMFYGISQAKLDELKKEIEFCPYIETYDLEGYFEKEKHYEELDVVDLTKEIKVSKNNFPEPSNMVSKKRFVDDSKTMRGWVLNEVSRHGINPAEADCIIQKESGWNDKAYNENANGSNDAGIFQINSVHNLSLAERYDYKTSTRYAIKLYKRQGWKPWTTRTKCGL